MKNICSFNHNREVPKAENSAAVNIKNRLFQGLVGLFIVILFIFVFSALANIVWKGMGGLVQSLYSREIQFAIRLSIFTSVSSTLICIFFALPVAYGLERLNIPGGKFISVVLDIPLSLPPLVSGVALLILFGTTTFGHALAEHGLRFIFSAKGIVLAQFFIITPISIN